MRALGTVVGVAVAVLAAVSCLPPPDDPRRPPPPDADPASLYAEHRENGRYFNPWGRFDKRPLEVLRFLFGRRPWDKSMPPVVPRVRNDGAYLAGHEPGATLTWVGHATYALHDGDDVWLTDPHWGPRALVPRRQTEPGIPLAAIPPDALAVVSHSHYDHLDAWTVERLPETVRWFVPRGLGDWFARRGRERVVELDWWQSAKAGRFTVTCLPSQHWSRRIEHPTNTTLWCSWLLEADGRRYFFAGDTGYFPGFAEFGRRFPGIDVALLPIGAYEPRWFMRYQHLDPEEAYRAFEDLGARYALPMHWGTFDLTYEPIDEAARVWTGRIQAPGRDPARSPLLAVGERWRLPAAPTAPEGGG